MQPKTHYYFVYRVASDSTLDDRTPCGGVVVRGWTELAAVDKAFRQAYQRFPCKPQEMLVLIPVRDQVKRRQAMLMERDWDRAFQKFEELMTVS